MENCCMDQNDVVLSSPAWQFRMLHLAHRTATDALLDKYDVRDCGHPFILFLLEHCGADDGFVMQKELRGGSGFRPPPSRRRLKRWRSRAASYARRRKRICAASASG